MKFYVFAVSNKPVSVASASIEAMEENCEEYFVVVLHDDDELRILLGLLGISCPDKISLPSNADFSSVFDYSDQLLPQLGQDDFDSLYEEWLRRSGRETSMDEYGQLLFLQSRPESWNKLKSRFVLCETYVIDSPSSQE